MHSKHAGKQHIRPSLPHINNMCFSISMMYILPVSEQPALCHLRGAHMLLF